MVLNHVFFYVYFVKNQKAMRLIIISAIFSWLSPISTEFRQLICEYEIENISIEISKKDLIKGFSKIDKLTCIEELNISSFWFTIIRNGKQSNTEIIKFENRKEIPALEKSLQKGDIINFTIICNITNLERRDKTITIK